MGEIRRVVLAGSLPQTDVERNWVSWVLWPSFTMFLAFLYSGGGFPRLMEFNFALRSVSRGFLM
jgi:hypothetical protein